MKNKEHKKFLIIGCHILWRELCHYASVSSNTLNFQFLQQGLHNTPDILKEELQAAIDSAPGDYDAILVAYGLCSNGIDGITAGNTRLVFMRGHDCITFLLGSKERYKDYVDSIPGTYWYSPGWIDNGYPPGKETYEKTLQSYIEKHGEDNAEYLMEVEHGWQKRYSNAAYVDMGFYDTVEYKAYTKECADWLGWECDFMQGSPRLIINFLKGKWDSEDFLVVEPGETVVASHDERVIEVK